ncbi:uncharacterized protein LOC141632094 [Silene latifolia]|uniref:uncharacterized protein LOC141632094 n=1 Tax=Silene latifolia TaxID=37657 RepID=UPI003D781EF1
MKWSADGDCKYFILPWHLEDSEETKSTKTDIDHQGKSNVYFNGVSSEVRREIVQVSGCIEGKLPFKYLGVPIKPSKLSIKDCQPLIDKVFERIRQLGTKKLSYARRLVLIKALSELYIPLRASIFIIPKAVLLKIEAICRNFLWHGGTEYARTPTVAWCVVMIQADIRNRIKHQLQGTVSRKDKHWIEKLLH